MGRGTLHKMKMETKLNVQQLISIPVRKENKVNFSTCWQVIFGVVHRLMKWCSTGPGSPK